MTSDAISVLIPTYNRAAFLPGTLRSVFAQTLPPSEVILVDDGSTDDTRAVVASLLSTHPTWANRLTYVFQQNQGKSAALNQALSLARGQWIAFNDSDDTWLPDKLEQQFHAFERFPDCLASFTETSRNEFNTHPRGLHVDNRECFGRLEAPSGLYVDDWPGTYMQTVVVRADVMKQCGDFDVRYRVEQDVDFLFRLGLLTPFCYVNLPLVTIDRSPTRTLGLTTTYPYRSLERMLVVESMLSKWLSLAGVSHPGLRHAVKRTLSSAHSELANRYILAGDVPTARQMLRKGLKDSCELRIVVKLLLAYSMPTLLRKFATGRVAPESQPG